MLEIVPVSFIMFMDGINSYLIMIYGIELKEILDKCNLSDIERVKFEDFMDSKVIKNKEAYPNEVDLKKAIETDPLLNQVRKKIYIAGQWGNIIALWHKMY